eukprot:NODE_17406_length_944_cov_3.388005.p1 GENE.NODE_17406_length_944_cov_3.388005~~NODE_17406_length_944_cov_3.388005.p1  ORF type:complete len:284 (-),score=91.28 NODE_17406_length_944_cov_3.388005:91-903(-)
MDRGLLSDAGLSPGSGSGHIALTQASQHPAWLEVVEDVRDMLIQIRKKLVQLTRAQERRKQDVFDDKHRSDPQAVASNISTLIRKCEQRIVLVKTRDVDFRTSTTERDLRQNIQRNLASQLHELSQQFKQGQKDFIAEIQPQQCGTHWDTDPHGPTVDDGFTGEQLSELATMERTAVQKSEEISSLASSVTELHTVFKELAVLIIDQGTMLDRIDYNIEQVVHQSQESNKLLAKAEKSAKSSSSRALKCMIFLVIANVILMIILITKVRS